MPLSTAPRYSCWTNRCWVRWISSCARICRSNSSASSQQQVGITFVYVTHDQEAHTMSDTVVVMNEAYPADRYPQDIYNEPKTPLWLTSRRVNIIDGIMHDETGGGGCTARKFPCLDGGFQPNEPVEGCGHPPGGHRHCPRGAGPAHRHCHRGHLQGDALRHHRPWTSWLQGLQVAVQTTDFSPVGPGLG